MRFDLTPEASLEGKSLKIYRRLRIALYISAIIGASYLSFKILFPSSYFEFSFANPSAKSNTITQPADGSGEKVKKGKLPDGTEIQFAASLTGIFSEAEITFSLDEKSNPIEGQPLAARKSHSAFRYPEGESLGCEEQVLYRFGRQAEKIQGWADPF